LDKKKILIIDDEPHLVAMIKRRLEASGFDVSVAQDGTAGLEEAAAVKPDLILLDVMMPGMDGYEVLKLLRERVETAAIRVVMFTAGTDPNGQKKSAALGADDYVNKSVPFEDVLQKIRILLYES
jgi:two-component system, OmpR family, alkaline phosphatase synthesis response regulator PhoP